MKQKINNQVADLQQEIVDLIKNSRFIENGDGNIDVQYMTMENPDPSVDVNETDPIIYGIRVATRNPKDRSRSCNGGDYFEDLAFINSDAGIIREEWTSCEMVSSKAEVVLPNIYFSHDTWKRLVDMAYSQVELETEIY